MGPGTGVFTDNTRAVDVGGWHQGAAMEVGAGRIVVLREVGR